MAWCGPEQRMPLMEASAVCMGMMVSSQQSHGYVSVGTSCMNDAEALT